MTIVVTSETGGTAQPAETAYVPPDRQVVDAGSDTALVDAGVNASFVADLLSAVWPMSGAASTCTVRWPAAPPTPS